MFSLHFLGPLWALRASGTPIAPSLPVFQSMSFYYVGDSIGVLNTIDTWNPFDDDVVEAWRIDPIDVNQGVEPVLGDYGNVLYDPKSDYVFGIASTGVNSWALSKVDSRTATRTWVVDLTPFNLSLIQILGVSQQYVWVRGQDEAGRVYRSFDVVTGAPVHTLNVPTLGTVPTYGTNIDALFDHWEMAVADLKLCLGQGFDSGTSTYYAVFLTVTGTNTYTLQTINLNSNSGTGMYPDTAWPFYDGNLYVANDGAQPGDPLFQVINLTTMAITNINTTANDVDYIYTYEITMNEAGTRIYVTDQGDRYARCLEFDISVPGWSYLGSYGTHMIESDMGVLAEKYYYCAGYVFGTTYNGESYGIWPVGEYSVQAPYATSSWQGYRNYGDFAYGVPRYNPWNFLSEPSYQPGKATGVWMLPPAARSFTAPSYPSTPPSIDGTLVDGTNNLNHTAPIMWYQYTFTGLETVVFNPSAGRAFIYDSDGQLLTRKPNSVASIQRSLCLPGTYYIAVTNSVSFLYVFASHGLLLVDPSSAPIGPYTIDVDPGVTEG